MIKVTPNISIPENEIVESFIKASGPGGQNVNKVSTAVQLRFDVTASNSIPNGVKLKLRKVAGKRMTKDGIIVLTVRNSRSQSSNRSAALQRLLELIRSATIENRPRYPTKPSILAKKKRVESKKKRGQLKRLRSKVLNPD